jgi:hypothetical protein
VPLDPEVPLDPFEPDVPLDPDEPDVPRVPELPDVPEDPTQIPFKVITISPSAKTEFPIAQKVSLRPGSNEIGPCDVYVQSV